MIDSRIDGEFDGWTGETVFPLQNGQYWQQKTYAYRYHYAYAPAVRIVSDGGSHLLHVDGIDESIAVEPADVVVDSKITSQFDGLNRWTAHREFRWTGECSRRRSPSLALHQPSVGRT